MRHLTIHVDRAHADAVVEAARERDALSVSRWEATGTEGPIDVVSVQIPNRSLGPLLKEIEGLPQLLISFPPREVVAFLPPASKAPSEVKTLQARSALEIFLQSLQSIGSWPSFLAYAVAGAAIVWIGLFTSSVYLLLAAMLIAPFAGPAMTVSIATAAGDRALLKSGMTRYLAAIATTLLVTGGLTLVVDQQVITNLMVDVSQVSAVAVLLPLTAGAAGALNLVQPERSSLVSGASVGILVAASLAPPAGLLGMALAMGEWNFVPNALFLLLLQLVGINLSGTIVFRMYGLTSHLVRYDRGRRLLFYGSVAVSLLLGAGLLAWQFSGPLQLQRASEGSIAAQTVRDAIRDSALAEPVQVEARFPTMRAREDQIMLVTVYARPEPGVEARPERIATRLKFAIEQRLLEQNSNVVPLVQVTVLNAPAGIGTE